MEINRNTIPQRQLCMEKKCLKHTHSPAFGISPIGNKHAVSAINWLGDTFNPAMQRGLMGVTALFTQPLFDLHNKHVDEDTREISFARTLGKIIAGTFTGVIIRQGCVEISRLFTQNEDTIKMGIDNFNKKALAKGKKLKTFDKNLLKDWQQWLLPKEYKNVSVKEIKKYRNAIGTFLALGIMIFTNFLIDAPLTMFLTNVIYKYRQKHKPHSAVEKGGQN